MTLKAVLIFILILITFSTFCQFDDEVRLSYNGGGPERIENIDLDLDGDNDIVLAVPTLGKVSWHENLGNGVFAEEQYIINGGQGSIYHFNIGDIDLDGDLDLSMPVKPLNKIIWVENDGSMNFNNSHIITTNIYSPSHTELIDLDGDLDLDLISTSTSNDKIDWYENLGGGLFGPQQILSNSADNPHNISAADLDNDGDNDIVVSVPSEFRIYLFENLGGGTFAIEQYINTGAGLAELKLLDMDGDNLKDVIYAFRGASTTTPTGGIAWSKNLGGNSFQTPITINANPINTRTLDIADIDNDSDLDVICANRHPFYSDYTDSLIIYLNDGTQNFYISDVATFYVGKISYPTSVSVGDLNGDGTLDISMCSRGNNVNRATWYEHLGAGILGSEHHLFFEINGPISTDSKDINQDGLPDLVVLSSNDEKISWYQNLGDGAYANQQIIGFATDLIPHDMAIEDFNGDGDLDVVVCGFHKEIFHFENLGGGIYASGTVVAQDSMDSRDMHSADLNGDGNKDIVIANYYDDQLAWYPSLGNGTFGARTMITDTAMNTEHIWCEDLDGDGDIDLVASMQGLYGYEISWWENDGLGNFISSSKISPSSLPNSLTMADLDNDGLQDILSSSLSNDYIFWLKNNGNGSFSSKKFIDTDIHEPGEIRAADLDNDGDLDVVAISTDQFSFEPLNWYENMGNGQFSLANILVDNITEGSSLCLGDFDLDGDQDIAYTLFHDDILSYILNRNTSNRQVKGRLFIDVNQNQQFDSTDVAFSQAGIYSTPSSTKKHVYNDGRYFIILEDTTVYSIFPGTIQDWQIFTDSLTYSINADSTFSIIDSLDFGFYPVNFVHNIELDAVAGLPRCNDTINYWINYENYGTTLPNGIVSMKLDDSLSYINSNVTPDSIIGNTIYWSYDSLMYFSSEQINLFVGTPDFNSIGDTLNSQIQLLVLDGVGNIVHTVNDTLVQINICAYDPNDKQADPAGVDPPGYIDSNTPSLDYTIRFQNTGNDTAMVILIKDQLSDSLDWNSLQIKSFSHPMTYYISSSGEVTFSFNNINLPDSTVDNLGSQGYVKFNISLLPNLPLGTQIANTAKIYFDLNPPIITNTKLNTLYNCENIFQDLPSSILCTNQFFNFSSDLSITHLDWSITGITSNSGNQINWLADTVGTFPMTIHGENTFCAMDTTFNLTIHPELPINLLDTITICNGEYITIFSQFLNSSGVYTQTLTSMYGCDSILAKTLVVLPEIPTNFIDTLYICSNDSIQIFGSYENQPGLYENITQTAFGCDSTNAYYISLFPNNMALPVTNATVCDGDSLLLFGSYQSDSGIYSQIYNSINGCDSLAEILLTVNPNPNVSIGILAEDTVCANSPPFQFDNSLPSGGSYAGTGLTGNVFNPEIAGVGDHFLSYTYIDTNGCLGIDSVQILVDGCLELFENNLSSVSIEPNPFSFETIIRFGSELNGEFDVQLINMLGQVVKTIDTIEGDSITLNRNNLKSGMYMFKLTNRASGQTILCRLMVD